MIKTIKKWVSKFFDTSSDIIDERTSRVAPCPKLVKTSWVFRNQNFKKPIWWDKANYRIKGWYYNRGPEYFEKTDIHISANIFTEESESLYLCPINELPRLMNLPNTTLVDARLLKNPI